MTKRDQALRLDPSGRERRIAALDGVQVRADENDSKLSHFSGHAAVFNSPTLIRSWFDEFQEEVAPGAFRKTISEADVRLLFNHDPNRIMARNRSGTLRLSEDDTGLLSEADLDRRQSYTNDVAIGLERGDISQMSFGFQVIKDEWDTSGDVQKRTLLEVKLFDVSPVTYPAYTDTDAALRGEGFDKLSSILGLDKDTSARLLRSLVTGEPEPDLAPDLAAAGEALQDLARSAEPLVKHSAEMARRRLSVLGARAGLTL